MNFDFEPASGCAAEEIADGHPLLWSVDKTASQQRMPLHVIIVLSLKCNEA